MTTTKLPEKLSNFALFKSSDDKINIDVYFHNETLWLTQKIFAELFQDRSVISKHQKNIFEEGELDEKVLCAKFALTTQHGAIDDKMDLTENRARRGIQNKQCISDFDEEVRKLISKNTGHTK